MTFISIHAPRMGSDLPAKPASRSMSISIHAPRMGSDLPSMVGEPCPVRFQSTLPGWGATGLRRRWGRPDQISIHAPRMGSDEAGARMAAACMEFQSTLPGWGATWQCRYGPAPHSIFQSTLPGWGATCRQCDIRRRSSDFNPRSPDGERLICDIIKGSVSRISIHAPRMGSDASDDNRSCPMADFNPRSPDGERLAFLDVPAEPAGISIHAPRMGSDRWLRLLRPAPRYFNPRSPDGERPRKWTSSPTIWAKSSIFNTDCIADRR